MDRIQWKHLTNDVARAEMTAWTRTQIKKRGRVNAYIQIARERQHRSGVYGQFPAYLRIPGLGRQARHAIAAMRLQSNQFVVTHAAYRETAIYGPARPEYQTRTCVWPHCANPPPGLAEQPVDDALHIFFRRLYVVNPLLSSVALALELAAEWPLIFVLLILLAPFRLASA